MPQLTITLDHGKVSKQWIGAGAMRRSSRFQTLSLAVALVLLAVIVIGLQFREAENGADSAPRLALLQLMEKGDYAAVADRLAQVRSGVEPEGAGDSVLLRHMYAFSSSNPELLPVLEKWLAAAPNSSIAHLAMGMHLRHFSHLRRGGENVGETSEGQWEGMYSYAEKAAFHYQKATELDASNTLAWNFLANLPGRIRPQGIDWDSVLETHAPYSESTWYQALFKAQPKWGGSIFRLQALLGKLEQRVDQNPSLKRLRGFDQFAIADEHYFNGDFKASRAACERAVNQGRHPRFLHMCAMAYNRLEDYSIALSMIDEALAESPEDTRFMEQRARILRNLDRMDEALEMLDRSLRYDGQDPDALEHKALYLMQENLLDEALQAIEAARVHGDHDNDIHVLESRINYAAGYYEKAAKSAERGVELTRNESYPLLRLAMAYNKLFDCPNLHDALRAFLASCRMHDDCRQTNTKWATGTLELMETHPACEAWRQQRDLSESAGTEEVQARSAPDRPLNLHFGVST